MWLSDDLETFFGGQKKRALRSLGRMANFVACGQLTEREAVNSHCRPPAAVQEIIVAQKLPSYALKEHSRPTAAVRHFLQVSGTQVTGRFHTL